MKLAFVLAALVIQTALPQAKTGEVTGRLSMTNGTAAVGVRVAALAAPEEGLAVPTLVAFGQSDSTGYYRIEGIDPGRYFIMAGMIELPTYYPGVLSTTSAKVISVTAGNAITGVDFILAAAPSLLKLGGRLVLPAGQKTPSNARVVATGANWKPGAPVAAGTVAQATITADGRFEFNNLRPASYALTLSFAPLASPVVVALVDQNVSGIEILVPKLFSVSGRLVFPPGQQAVGRPVVLITNATAGRTESAARPDGGFEFVGMPPGEYDLRLNLVPLGAPTRLVISDRDITGMEIPIPVVASISTVVEVEGGGGTPPPLSISIENVSSRNGNVDLSTAGIFSIIPLAEGDYRLAIKRVPAGYAVKSIRVGLAVLSGDVFSVSGPEPQAILVTLARDSAVRVSGRIASRPLPTTLTFYASTSGAAFETTVQADGSFTFPGVLPNTYTLQAFPMNAATSPTSITVPANGVSDLVITIPAIVELTGRITVEGGSRAPLFGLVFTAMTGSVISAVLDGSSDGVFKLALPEGEYRVSTALSSQPVKALTFGSTDLLTTPLKLSAGSPSEIHLTFAMPR